jgi:hypothetical protein
MRGAFPWHHHRRKKYPPRRPEIWPQLPDVYDEVQQAIQLSRPDRLWVPAYEGGNPDHDAVNALASTIKSVGVRILEYHLDRRLCSIQPLYRERRGGELVHRLTPAGAA